VPPRAEIVLSNCLYEEVKTILSPYQRIAVEEVAEGVKIIATGISKHASVPEDSLNALQVLLDALLATHLLEDSVVADFTCVKESMDDCHGASVGAPYQDALSGKISHILGKASVENDVLEINFDMRVPIRVDCTEVKAAMTKHFALSGFAQVHDHIFPSKYTDPSCDWVQELTRISNEVLHQNEQPYVVGGGTYARKFKNAVSFGTNIKGEKSLFAENKGNPHQCDECVSINSLLQGIKIYIKSIVYLDEKLGYEE
jgi:succinyl-diaminopimelate desuccinylase